MDGPLRADTRLGNAIRPWSENAADDGFGRRPGQAPALALVDEGEPSADAPGALEALRRRLRPVPNDASAIVVGRRDYSERIPVLPRT